MTLRDISLTAVMTVSMLGCAGADDDPGDAVTESGSAICTPAQAVCSGDTVCGETGCEPAFDRRYAVRVVEVWLAGKGFERCFEDPDCRRADVTVHYSEAAAPILSPASVPPVAEVVVAEGSYLVIELAGSDCMIELTAERLRSGRASCGGFSHSARVTLDPLPM